MRMVDIIEKKREGIALSEQEIDFVIGGYVQKEIPDYQMSALLMAIYFQGMSDQESSHLTKAMLHSGDVIDLSLIEGIKVDKHSTGGVGDKTTLVLGPLVASLGINVAKLSGRGLGHTGGTLDKLESIEGFSIELSEEAFIEQVNRIHIAVAGQTGEIVPADKMLYALRDVTATVPSIPLIASSIMSKKLASGADVICLDVKVGDGAFMKTIDEAKELSHIMVNIGAAFGKKVIAFLTNMDEPLGRTIGNRLEVQEAIETLSGKGPADFEALCLEIAAHMIFEAKQSASIDAARQLAKNQLMNGKALAKFHEMITAQGGEIPNLATFVKVKSIIPYHASNAGTIHAIKAYNIGIVSMQMGGGRATKDDIIDPMVGIVLCKKVGDQVNIGDVLANLYVNHEITSDMMDLLEDAFVISTEPVGKQSIILDIIR